MFSITSGPLCGFPSPLMCAPIAIAPDGVFKNVPQTWHLYLYIFLISSLNLTIKNEQDDSKFQ